MRFGSAALSCLSIFPFTPGSILSSPSSGPRRSICFLADLLLEALGLFRVEGRLRFLDERHDVALLENAPRHAVRMELFQRVGLLADANVLDGFLRHPIDGEGRAPPGVAVQLREDDAR